MSFSEIMKMCSLTIEYQSNHHVQRGSHGCAVIFPIIPVWGLREINLTEQGDYRTFQSRVKRVVATRVTCDRWEEEVRWKHSDETNSMNNEMFKQRIFSRRQTRESGTDEEIFSSIETIVEWIFEYLCQSVLCWDIRKVRNNDWKKDFSSFRTVEFVAIVRMCLFLFVWLILSLNNCVRWSSFEECRRSFVHLFNRLTMFDHPFFSHWFLFDEIYSSVQRCLRDPLFSFHLFHPNVSPDLRWSMNSTNEILCHFHSSFISLLEMCNVMINFIICVSTIRQFDQLGLIAILIDFLMDIDFRLAVLRSNIRRFLIGLREKIKRNETTRSNTKTFFDH